MAERSDIRRGRGVAATVLGVIVGLLGLWLLGFGAYLAVLGGSI